MTYRPKIVVYDCVTGWWR